MTRQLKHISRGENNAVVTKASQYEQRLVEILTEAQERGEEIRIAVMNKTALPEKPEIE
ncbi:MAG: hypothetical protein LBC19_06760 [Tannerella sp.]|nr:hypothetical protein [Tannerella sp.]